MAGLNGIKLESMTGGAYCACGSSMTLSAEPAAYQAAITAFWQQHAAEGHSPVSKDECRKARRRARTQKPSVKQEALL